MDSPNTENIVEIRDYLIQSSKTKLRTSEECAESIAFGAGMIAETFLAGAKVLLCGNGGSAADCQHMATEFVSRLTKDFERPGLPAIALTTDSSFLTAFSNDTGFEGIFERQVQTLGKPGDLLIGISTSGNSLNVIRAVEAARSTGIRTLVLTGQSGRLKDLSDAAIAIPSDDTQHIQEAHLAVEHLLCHLAERQVFTDEHASRTATP
jgi:phosphoheptose isomerase